MNDTIDSSVLLGSRHDNRRIHMSFWRFGPSWATRVLRALVFLALLLLLLFLLAVTNFSFPGTCLWKKKKKTIVMSANFEMKYKPVKFGPAVGQSYPHLVPSSHSGFQAGLVSHLSLLSSCSSLAAPAAARSGFTSHKHNTCKAYKGQYFSKLSIIKEKQGIISRGK